MVRPIRHSSKIDAYLVIQFRVFNAVVRPIRRLDAVARLPRGELVSWRFVGEAMFITVILYSGILGLAGTLFFRRRELGLPLE